MTSIKLVVAEIEHYTFTVQVVWWNINRSTKVHDKHKTCGCRNRTLHFHSSSCVIYRATVFHKTGVNYTGATLIFFCHFTCACRLQPDSMVHNQVCVNMIQCTEQSVQPFYAFVSHSFTRPLYTICRTGSVPTIYVGDYLSSAYNAAEKPSSWKLWLQITMLEIAI